MIGLVRKDFYLIQKYMKTMSLLVLFYGVLQIIQPASQYLTSMISLFGLMIMFTIFGYDDQSKWHIYSKALPLSSKEIVIARYISATIASIVCGVLGTVIGFIFNVIIKQNPLEQWLPPIWVTLGMMILLDTILFPLIYKFGVEKSRFVLMGIVIIPIMLTAILSKNIDLTVIQSIKESTIIAVIIAFPFICLLLYIVSYFVSASIFEKNEY